jgi:Kdo2-lipid IVA lauroyltransferase/acyltransferase
VRYSHPWWARLARALAVLPLSVVIALATGLGWLLCLLPPRVAKVQRIVLVNTLACFPGKSWPEARRFARRSLIETVRTIAGFSHIWLRPAEESLGRIDRVHGEAAWNRAVASERPILYLSLHHSSWELPVLLLGKRDPALVMHQDDGDNMLADLVREGRSVTGCTLVPASHDGLRSVLAGLGRGQSLALLADHKPRGRANPFARFFGHEVMAPAFVHKVIRRYQPHVFFLSAQRLSDYRFDVWLEEADPEILAMDEAGVLRAMMAGFERIILRNPVQYQWTYKRFTRAPSGSRDWYARSPELLARIKAGESPALVFRDPDTDPDPDLHRDRDPHRAGSARPPE